MRYPLRHQPTSIKFGAHLAQKVERWPFKPMVVGSIPTVGDLKKYFFAADGCHHQVTRTVECAQSCLGEGIQ